MKRRQFLALASSAAAAAILTACGKKEAASSAAATATAGSSAAAGNITIKVGATPVPHADLLKVAAKNLEKEGVTLQIIEFNDYVQPNTALEDKSIDANFFQHKPYLDDFLQQHKTHLLALAPIHIEPIGLYAGKSKDLKNIKNGATIAIPNDATNEGRALLILQNAGYIKLRPGSGLQATPLDITSNPKKLKFVEIEAPQLPRALPDVAAAAVNGTYARPAGLSIAKQGVLVESAKGSAYANVLVVRTADKNKPWVKTSIKAYHQPNVKAFIEKRFGDSTFPAW